MSDQTEKSQPILPSAEPIKQRVSFIPNTNTGAVPTKKPRYPRKKKAAVTDAAAVPQTIAQNALASAQWGEKVQLLEQTPSKPATDAPAKPKKNNPPRRKPASGVTTAVLLPEKKERNANVKSHRDQRKPATRKQPVRIIPLGGIGEIGKNITAYECGNDIIVVDCGLAFPDENMLGVDIVIADYTFLEKNRDRIRGLFITHGHEDHIGGIPFLMKQINIPIYGTRLTLGLIEGKLKEHGLLNQVQLNVVKARDTVKAGCMEVEFIHVNHSIPDACALAIHTPAGVIIQTGDFKVDYTPIQGGIIDLARFGELGSKGVLALLPDSTNAETPGSTMSERSVGESFDRLFKQAIDKRIIIATFASNVHRVQQIFDYSIKYGKKVAVSGRSMENVVEKSIELGYLKVPVGTLIEVDAINRLPANQVVIITTGSQGEPMSALTRMANGDHRKVTVSPHDFIIISARPIPGNEKLVGRVVNELLRLGAEVIYEKMYEVHVSGHACQDELKLIMSLTKPKYVIPMHGEYKHLAKQKSIALSLGIPEENILIPELGKVMETDGVDFKYGGVVTAGRVLVDGLGVGDVGSIVLRDRKHLAQDGLIVVVATIDAQTGQVVAGPDLISRGFVYVREAEEMIRGARSIAAAVLADCTKNGVKDWGNLKQRIKDEINRYVYGKTKRNPMILPVIQEI